jgi:hypothetical protein
VNDDSLPFVDLLFNLLLGYAFLFLVSFLLIQPIVKKADIKTQAEYVITVTWPINNTDDVDVWLEDPLENVIYFRNKEAGLSHLDRDDLGHTNDVIHLADGTAVRYPYNQEIMTIRGYIGGEWTLNVHMYSKRIAEPTTVKVQMDKLNPSFKTVLLNHIVLTHRGEEVTVARFTMGSNGDILELNNMSKDLIQYATGGGP